MHKSSSASLELFILEYLTNRSAAMCNLSAVFRRAEKKCRTQVLAAALTTFLANRAGVAASGYERCRACEQLEFLRLATIVTG